MKKIKIVMGANFGDEGKGLITDYFANEAKKQNRNCITVCHNGGSQKGHTVVTDTGLRHVFHHFGSGMLKGADTYLSDEFIVNPIVFLNELNELKKMGFYFGNVFVSGKCKVTTPFDMMMNQIAEEYRGDGKYGSCGLGIFETIKRHNDFYALSVCDMLTDGIEKVRLCCQSIKKEYFYKRLKYIGIADVPSKWIDILDKSDIIIDNFTEDCKKFVDNIKIADDSIIEKYDYIIFEGAQGLLLDKNNEEYFPHLTPSNTGIVNPIQIIKNIDADIEVCYVTRTYLTRHGAGKMENECNKVEINSEIRDLTNVYNPFQEELRYGKLNLSSLKARVEQDLKKANISLTKSIAFTHCNEFSLELSEVKAIFDDFKIYVSDGLTCKSVTKI